MSRIVRIHEYGDASVLRIEDVAVPAPAADEVQIAVKAIGINRAEVMFRNHAYLQEAEFPSRLGYEAAGYPWHDFADRPCGSKSLRQADEHQCHQRLAADPQHRPVAEAFRGGPCGAAVVRRCPLRPRLLGALCGIQGRCRGDGPQLGRGSAPDKTAHQFGQSRHGFLLAPAMAMQAAAMAFDSEKVV